MDIIFNARERTLSYFKERIIQGEVPYGVMSTSSHQDVGLWPSMLIPGTYNGMMALNLLDSLDDFFSRLQKKEIARWLLQFRRDNGTFYLPQITDETVGKRPHFNPDAAAYYTLERCWEYLDGHVTNYCLGALESLGHLETPNLSFVDYLLDPKELLAWLALRDMRDPWAEGNFIVNLASFYFLMLQNHDIETKKVVEAIKVLTEWHYRYVEPSTGFWGISQNTDSLYALHAMAGACHNYHLFFKQNIPVPHFEKAVDWCLTQPPSPATTACIDVDLIDILANAYSRMDYRREEVRDWLSKKLEVILLSQNEDGGFPDDVTAKGIRQFDTWKGGYEEPQGISNNFATFFRWIAIAMICDILYPQKYRWNFRKMLGIGYYKRGPLR